MSAAAKTDRSCPEGVMSEVMGTFQELIRLTVRTRTVHVWLQPALPPDFNN
jgi:hypothetical protein